MRIQSAFLLALSITARGQVLGTATVDLSINKGTPKHLASGFIYGIPDAPNQIPDHFYTDMGFNFARAGGAQVLAPGRGWVFGLTEYKNRFASALSNYKTARKFGASFTFLIHDLWGADGSDANGIPYPGDNGNWTSWDNYITQLLSDLHANGVSDGLSIDIWNEPDISPFWTRTTAQWLQMWGRTYHRLRTAVPSVLLLGPTLANQPAESNTWWTQYLDFVKTNSSIPDKYVWHLEGGPSAALSDIQINNATFTSMLASRGLPWKQLDINEYGVLSEQVPSGAAWWISRLERYEAIGLRGNWLSTTQLHDFMASLLGKTNSSDPTGTGYWPNGEYQVYKYYNLNMTGHRVGTTGSADRLIDVYSTVTTANKAKLLVGVRQQTGTWQVTVKSLSTVGYATSGSLKIQTWGFPDVGHMGQLLTPNNLGIVSHTYSGNAVTFPIFQTDTGTAFAFELL